MKVISLLACRPHQMGTVGLRGPDLRHRFAAVYWPALAALMLATTALVGCEPRSACDKCPGCCIEGRCLVGTELNACGFGGSTCTACTNGTTCVGGQCVPQGGSDCSNGCRDAAGACRPGNTNDLCGTGGATCQPCTLGNSCNGEQCAAVCTHQNCNGCCDPISGQCLNGFDSNSCGARGIACEACTPGSSCIRSQCVRQTASGCTGCLGCCANGICLDGLHPNACGKNGAACATCPSNSVCNGTSCIPIATCNRQNCSGCCTAAGKCLSVDRQGSQSCGKGAEACFACSPSSTGKQSAFCSQGTCIVDQPCFSYCKTGCCTSAGQCIGLGEQSPQACGLSGLLCDSCQSGQACLRGNCQDDPVWLVSVTSLIIAETKVQGTLWDPQERNLPAAKPDPLVQIRTANTGGSWVTTGGTIRDTLTPNFTSQNRSPYGENAAMLANQGIEVLILDEDLINDDEIGRCRLKLPPQLLSGGSFILERCGDRATSLALRFVPQ